MFLYKYPAHYIAKPTYRSFVRKSIVGLSLCFSFQSTHAEINVVYSFGKDPKVVSYRCFDEESSTDIACPDFIQIKQEIHGPVLRAFGNANFSEIERIYEVVKDGNAKFDDGTWKLSSLETAFISIFGRNDSHRASFEAIKQWKLDHPKSIIVQFAEAAFWRNRAWSVRSSSSIASREELQIFNERMDKSLAILLKLKTQGNELALIYPALIKFSIERNSDAKAIYDYFQVAQKEFPTLHATYLAYASSLFPSYRKTKLDLDAFARFATTLPNQPDGEGMYARLLLSADDHYIYPISFENDDLKSSELLRSMKDLTIRHPTSALLLNQYAHLLCRTTDTDGFLAAMKRLSVHKHGATFKVVSKEACTNRHKPKLGTGV
jgi:Domain of unknown function (DUF4034)